MRVFSLLIVALLLNGCSSIPDVVYDDQIDSGATKPSSSSSGGSSSGNPSDGGDGFNCTNNKPPVDKGVCCGTRLCLKCNLLQCDRCGKENCDSDEVCCAVNSGVSGSSIACRKQTACQ